MNNFTNTLYYGDNLDILRNREYFPNESVDLIYLDPPFNSKKAYSIFFKDKLGDASKAQIQAFEDTWAWGDETRKAYDKLMESNEYPEELKDLMSAFDEFMHRTNLMAYLIMMAVRLVELHRVLKDTGSIYLHCDPTAGHYLKIIMDHIFGIKNFRNEIVWKRTFAHNDPRRFGNNFDMLLFYSKSNDYFYNPIFVPYSQNYIDNFFRYEENGRKYQLITLTGPKASKGASGKPWRGYDPSARNRSWSVSKRAVLKLVGEEKAKQMSIFERLELLYRNNYIAFSKKGVPRFKQFLDEMSGAPAQAIWDDISPVSAHSKEYLPYPTQKPLALLERIINASSREGDIVLDPFCGCGTAVVAAEKLGRKWIGIDITHLAVALMKKRLKDHFPDVQFNVVGEPETFEAAKELAEQNKFQFEAWAVSLLGGQPYKSKGGGDRGVDGILRFKDFDDGFHKIIIQVKGGNYTTTDVKSVKATIDNEHACLGILIALKPPTKGMLSYAASLGTWQMPGSLRKYPVLQIFTIEDYFSDIRPDLPDTSMTLKKANREIRESEKPQKLDL